MKTVCTVWALVVTLLLANLVVAGAKKEGRKEAGVAYFQTIDRYLKPVTLTDEQKSKLNALKKECEPKFKEIYAKQEVLTPEQKKAGEEAKKAAMAEGKKGKELNAAIAAAVKETADQKKQEKEAAQELRALEKELHGKVVDLLTPEQKAKIEAARPKKGEKKAKRATKPRHGSQRRSKELVCLTAMVAGRP